LTSDLPALKELLKFNVSGDLFEFENSYDLVDIKWFSRSRAIRKKSTRECGKKLPMESNC